MRPNDLPIITVRDLSRYPGRVLERVDRGERFVVTRHGAPVATLQPLDGVVVQPLTGEDFDITGARLRDVEDELAALTDLQRQVLAEGVKFDRVYAARLICGKDLWPNLQDLQLRGLVRREERGYVLTGRGMVLSEYLRTALGTNPKRPWKVHARRDAVRSGLLRPKRGFP